MRRVHLSTKSESYVLLRHTHICSTMEKQHKSDGAFRSLQVVSTECVTGLVNEVTFDPF